MSSFFQLIVISISLALDAVSVSIAEGIEVKEEKIKHALRIAFVFGAAQAIMPLIGWFVGSYVKTIMAIYAPWIALILLISIGSFMLKEAFTPQKKKKSKRSTLSHKTLFLLAVATSIDAFTVGITLGLIDIPLLLSISMIGVITFALCLPAFLLGFHLNKHFEGKLDAIGGIALILLGLKIFFEHIH